MKIAYILALAIGLVVAGCSGGSDQSAKATNTTSNAASSNDAPGGYLGALSKAQKTAVGVVDTASLNQKLNQFNIDKGRYPKDLNELVQEGYMKELPPAPYGSKIVYDSTTGTVKVVKE